jgi:hypothetical protein
MRMRKCACKVHLPARKDSQDTSDTTGSPKCGVQHICVSDANSTSSEDECNETRLTNNTASPSSADTRNAVTPSASPILRDQWPAVGAERFTCPGWYFRRSSKWYYWDYRVISALNEWAEWLIDGESGYIDTTTMKWVTTPRTDIN